MAASLRGCTRGATEGSAASARVQARSCGLRSGRVGVDSRCLPRPRGRRWRSLKGGRVRGLSQSVSAQVRVGVSGSTLYGCEFGVNSPAHTVQKPKGAGPQGERVRWSPASRGAGERDVRSRAACPGASRPAALGLRFRVRRMDAGDSSCFASWRPSEEHAEPLEQGPVCRQDAWFCSALRPRGASSHGGAAVFPRGAVPSPARCPAHRPAGAAWRLCGDPPRWASHPDCRDVKYETVGTCFLEPGSCLR